MSSRAYVGIASRSGRGIVCLLGVVAALVTSAPPAPAVDLVGVTAVRFQWAPASGAVAAYLVYVARNGGEFPVIAELFTPPDDPTAIVQGRPGERIRVRVAAMGPQLAIGPFSPPSEEVRFVAAVNGVPTFDLNGDGASELVFQNGSTGALASWSALGSPAISAIANGITAGAVWTFVDAGDYDADGKSDVLWLVPGTSRHVLCRSDGESPRLCADFALLGTGSSIVGLGDVNLDGKRDVLVRSSGGSETLVCFGDGVKLTTCTASLGSYPATTWSFAAAGDQNADGRADVLLHQLSSGLVSTCFLTSMGGMSCTQAVGAPLGAGYRVLGIGDTDGDARGEVLFRNAATRVTLVCALANGVIRACGGLDVDGRWQVLGAGDYDADGHADVVWRDSGAGLVRIDFLSGLAAEGSPRIVPVGSSFRVLAR